MINTISNDSKSKISKITTILLFGAVIVFQLAIIMLIAVVLLKLNNPNKSVLLIILILKGYNEKDNK